jgi:hypothetical protein
MADGAPAVPSGATTIGDGMARSRPQYSVRIVVVSTLWDCPTWGYATS